MVSFNAATDPWIAGLRDGRPSVESLHSALTGDFTVATGYGLLDHAVHRLLLAITYTASGAPASFNPDAFDPAPVAEWVASNTALFNLTDPVRPFLQDATLTTAPKPLIAVDFRAAKDRPLLVDFRTYTDKAPPTPWEEAIRLLLVGQFYDVYGAHKGCGKGRWTACMLTGQITFRPGGNIRDALAWSWVPVTAVGRARWTYEERGTYKQPLDPDGAADGLMWFGRRYLLHASEGGEAVQGVAADQGWARTKNKTEPADSKWGALDVAVATDQTTTLMGGSASSPADPALAWWRSSDGSVAGWIRSVITDTHRPDHIIVTGHSVKQGRQLQVTVATLPDATLTVDPHPLRKVLKSAAAERLALPLATRTALYGDPEALLTPARVLASLAPPPPAERRVSGLFDKKQSNPESDFFDEEGVVSPTDREDPEQLHRLREVYFEVRDDPNATTKHSRSRALWPELRLMSAVLHQWFWEGQAPPDGRVDGKAPLPALLAHVDPDLAAHLTNYSFRGLAGPLKSAVEATKSTGYCPSWVWLYDELRNWGTPSQRHEWTNLTSPRKRNRA